MLGLSDLDVLIVDCQTTGATPALGAVLELAWCVVRPSRPRLESTEARCIALPEGHRVPAHVRRLTGFDERQRTDAIAPELAWQRLNASIGSGRMPTAIHFARFELAFLQDWSSRFTPEAPFPFDPVCVHAIACRLYPDLPRRSLRALAGHLGHGLELTRSSLGHVEATAFIWRKLSAVLAEQGVHTWSELGEWLAMAPPARSRSKKRLYPMPSERYRALPNEPGVYRFLRANGDVLYVGKAASLRKRVMSHFAARATREHALEMLTQVSDIQVTVTPTALEAALLENESIKSLRPPYNLQLTGYDTLAWFATRSFDAASTTSDVAHRIGPLPSAYSLRALGALIALCSGEAPTRALHARAVGTSERWAPDPAVFAAGFAEFARMHLGAGAPPLQGARRRVLGAAKRLVLAKVIASETDEPELDPSEPEPSAPATWDPERVTRHLERALGQAYQLLRRAQWLRLLHDSAIIYGEPTSARTRLLVMRGGALVDARDADLTERVLAPSPRLNVHVPPLAFERAKYDRLRILGSELKRVRRDHGHVSVYVAPDRRLGERVLDGIFGRV